MPYEVETYAPSQRDDYLRLLHDAWQGEGIGAAEFDWWFDGPRGSLRSVALTDGRVVGAAAHSWLRMILHGQERLVTFSLHAVTDAASRGRGIFEAIERRHEEEAQAAGAAVVISVPAESAGTMFLRKLGWASIAKLRLWARPFPRARWPRTVERRDTFEHEGDAASSWGENHVVRDSEHLSWRYLRSPRDYIALGDATGYAVVGHKRLRGQPVAYVADLVSTRPGALLTATLAAARAGSRAMIALVPRGQRAAFIAHGFVPTPLTLHFMGRGLNEPLDADARSWRLTLGDTDFF
jgi:Acetyltransferase (GNAT) domain